VSERSEDPDSAFRVSPPRFFSLKKEFITGSSLTHLHPIEVMLGKLLYEARPAPQAVKKIVDGKKPCDGLTTDGIYNQSSADCAPARAARLAGISRKIAGNQRFSPFRAWRRRNRRGRFERIAGGFLPAPRQALNAITINALIIAPNPRWIRA
jgi:hypothetical protein